MSIVDIGGRLFTTASRALDRGAHREARRLFRAGARYGDSSCQMMLAHLLSEGIGGTRNTPLAYRWYKRAYENGETTAAYNLGIEMQRAGNVAKARSWFERAATFGDLDACVELARIYVQDTKLKKLGLALLRMLVERAESGSEVWDASRQMLHELEQEQ